MSEPFSAAGRLPVTVRESWATRPAAAAAVRIASIYGRFHAPLAVLCSVVAVLPLFAEAVVIDGVPVPVETYAGLSNDGDRYYTGLALTATGLLLVLAALQAAAGLRGRHPAVPLLSSVVALAVVLLLWIGPELDEHRQSLSSAGLAALLIAGWAVPLGLAHAIRLWRDSPVSAPS